MFLMKFKEKELKMIWEVQKNNKKSFLIGTAHFFPYSFRTSLSRYIRNANTILFEGPLDKDNMAKVVNAGLEKENAAHLFEELDEQTIAEINEALAPPGRSRIPFSLFNLRTSSAETPGYAMIKGMKPWMAFFTIWTNFLEKKGWRYSVDLEAYGIAREMGKKVVSLETIDEQIEVLENLSHEKIVDFLKRVDCWNAHAQEYIKSYLDADLEKLKSFRSKFPTRHSSVIHRRDRILYERMLVYLEKGDTVAFVGAPHIPGISGMLRANGYQIIGQYTP
jgi:uncharacterized protein YbaP (TraB family)